VRSVTQEQQCALMARVLEDLPKLETLVPASNGHPE